jgi:hypothetical protein
MSSWTSIEALGNESYWANMPGFTETVQEAWSRVVDTQDNILRIHVKLLRTTKYLKNWRRKLLADHKIVGAILNITLSNLERAQESRNLTPDQLELKKYLKTKALGIAAMQKARA